MALVELVNSTGKPTFQHFDMNILLKKNCSKNLSIKPCYVD